MTNKKYAVVLSEEQKNRLVNVLREFVADQTVFIECGGLDSIDEDRLVRDSDFAESMADKIEKVKAVK